jgi:hypothetical protein
MASKFENQFSPLLLNGQVTVNTADQYINPTTILNPNRGPMLVDQFVFNGGLFISLATTLIEIRLGSIPLMPRPVSIFALCQEYNYRNFFGITGNPPTVPTARYQSNWLSARYGLVWKLPKPMYVPKNVQLSVRFVVEPNLYQPVTPEDPTGGIPQQVAVVGRSLSEGTPDPDRIWVPWTTDMKAQKTTASSYVSADNELVNSNDVPFHVRKFVGWNKPRDIAEITKPANLANYGYQTSRMFVQMTGSNGTAIVRDPTPWELLFPVGSRCFDVSATMQPGEFVRTEVSIPEIPPTLDLAVYPDNNQIQFTSITMQGYRAVDCPRAN